MFDLIKSVLYIKNQKTILFYTYLFMTHRTTAHIPVERKFFFNAVPKWCVYVVAGSCIHRRRDG